VIHLVRRLSVFRNMGVEQIQLALFRAGIGFADAGAAGTQGFHLRAQQHDANFERILDKIVVPRPAVIGNDPIPGSLLGGIVARHGDTPAFAYPSEIRPS